MRWKRVNNWRPLWLDWLEELMGLSQEGWPQEKETWRNVYNLSSDSQREPPPPSWPGLVVSFSQTLPPSDFIFFCEHKDLLFLALHQNLWVISTPAPPLFSQMITLHLILCILSLWFGQKHYGTQLTDFLLLFSFIGWWTLELLSLFVYCEQFFYEQTCLSAFMSTCLQLFFFSFLYCGKST